MRKRSRSRRSLIRNRVRNIHSSTRTTVPRSCRRIACITGIELNACVILSRKDSMSDRDDWVVVYSGSIVEADLLKCLLDGAGVESCLQNETLGMIAPYIFQGGAGVGVAVLREDLEAARPIVEDYATNKSRRLHEV